MKLKRWIAMLLICMLAFAAAGCQQKPAVQPNVAEMSWEEVLESARGTTVTLYGWGGPIRPTAGWTTTWPR